MNSLVSIIFVSVGLAMDAFVVAAAYGIILNRLKAKYALKIALFFGVFQGVMPILGYYFGNVIKGYLTGVATWMAGAIIFLIGVKMLYETLTRDKEHNCRKCMYAKADTCQMLKEKINKKLKTTTILLLAIATSIDALGVGISVSLLGNPILFPAFMIGIITFSLCLIGIVAGHKVSSFSERTFEIIGGIILILISIKIVI